MHAFFSHMPWWVIPLLLLLVALGAMQTRTRRVKPIRAIALPLFMLGWTLTHLSWQPAAFVIVASVLAVAGVCFWLGFPRGVAYDDASRRIVLPGSFIPLALMLTVFALRFANGVAQARYPALAVAPGFVLGGALVQGVVAGIFFSRLLACLRVLPAASTSSSPVIDHAR